MKKYERYLRLNLLLIFVVLNIWEFLLNRVIFNAMIIGIILFGPIVVLWYLRKFRATALLTLISIFEFMVILVFIWEGFELNGIKITVKSIFWLPFFVMAGLNTYWGLSIYSKKTEKK